MKSKSYLLSAAISALMLTTPALASTNTDQKVTTVDSKLVTHLTHMREEEKIARDVYRVLYQQTGINAFNNITQSEQRHMDAMARQLSRFNITDPVKNDATGEFTNPVFEKLYKELLQRGSASTKDALYVGAYIEELDIIDLEKAITETQDEMLKQVYGNLLRGSRNHLRAFVRQISRTGDNYQAQLMPQDQVNAILSSPQERGQGGRKGFGQGQGYGKRSSL